MVVIRSLYDTGEVKPSTSRVTGRVIQPLIPTSSPVLKRKAKVSEPEVREEPKKSIGKKVSEKAGGFIAKAKERVLGDIKKTKEAITAPGKFQKGKERVKKDFEGAKKAIASNFQLLSRVVLGEPVKLTEGGKPTTVQLSDEEYNAIKGDVVKFRQEAINQLDEAKREKETYYSGGIRQVDPAIEKKVGALQKAVKDYDVFLGYEPSNKGFVKELWSYIREVGITPDGYASWIPEAQGKAVTKYLNGQVLDKEEQAYLNTFRAKNYRSLVKKEVPELIADVTAEIPKYALLIAITKTATQPVTQAVGTQVIKLPPGIAQSIASKILTNSISLGIASNLNIPGIDEKTAEYMLPTLEVQQKLDKDILEYLKPGDAPMDARRKAYLTNLVEYVSEGAGGYIDDAVPFVKKAIIGKWLADKGVDVANPSLVKQALSTAQFNSIVGEVFEEEIAEPLLAGIEKRPYADPLFTPEGRERLLVETLGIGAFAGMAKVSDIVLNTATNQRNKNGDIVSFPVKVELPVEGVGEEEEKKVEEVVPEEKPPIETITEGREAEKVQETPKTFNYGGVQMPITNVSTEELTKIVGEATGGFRTDEQLQALRESIQREGIITPIEVVRSKEGKITSINNGIKRIRMAQELGIKEIPTITVEGEEPKAKVVKEIEKPRTLEQVKKEIIEEELGNIKTDAIDQATEVNEEKGYIVLYHKTTPLRASNIERTGFNAGSFFATSPESAEELASIKKGGVKVIEAKVALDSVHYNTGTSEFEASEKLKIGRDGIYRASDEDLRKAYGIEEEKPQISAKPTLLSPTPAKMAKKKVQKPISLPAKPKESVVTGERIRKVPSIKVEKVHKTIVPKNPQLPILSYVNVKNGKMMMTDLEYTAVINTDMKDGIYQVIGSDMITLDPKIAEDYPVFPKEGETYAQILPDNLAQGLKDALVFTSGDETRPVLNGIRLEIGNKKVRILATDGFRIFNKAYGIRGEKEGNILIWGKKAGRLVEDILKDGGKVDIKWNDKDGIASFSNENGTVTIRTIEGNYPEYERIYPETNRKIVVDKKALDQAMKDIAPYANDRANVTKFTVDPTVLTIKATNKDEVEKVIEVPIRQAIKKEVSGMVEGTLVMPIRYYEDPKQAPAKEFQINYKFIQDVIKTTPEDDVYISYFEDAKGVITKDRPIPFSGEDEEAYAPIKPIVVEPDTKEQAEIRKWIKSGNSQADMGGYVSTKNIADSEGYYKAVQFPEIVSMVRELLGVVPSVNYPRIRPSTGGVPLGLFHAVEGDSTGAKIVLNPDLFRSPEQAVKVFAHEVGHLADWLPDYTLKRGNLIGHIASLNDFLRKDFSGYTKNNRLNILVEKQKDLQEKRRGLKAEEREGGTQDKQYLEELKKVNKEIKDIRKNPDLILETLQNELKAVTQLWKPFNDTIPEELSPIEKNRLQAYINYRYSNKELYADAVSMLFNDPDLLKQTAPMFWDGFFSAIDEKPEFSKVYFETMDLLNKDEPELLAKREKDLREMFKKGEDLFRTKLQDQGIKKNDYVFRLKHEIIDRNQAVIDKVEQLKKKGKAVADEDNPVYFLEESNYVGGVVKAWLEKNVQPIYADLQANDTTVEDFGEVLFLERVIKERGGTRNPIKMLRETDKDLIEGSLNDLVERHRSELPEELRDLTAEQLFDDLESKSSEQQLVFLKNIFGSVVDESGKSLYDYLIDRLPKGIANPLGYDVETAQKQLDYLKSQLGDKYSVIERNLPKFRQAVKSLIPQAVEAELYKPEMAEKLIVNPAYATFQVLDYLDTYIPASIKNQVGTLKEVSNPMEATILKSISTIRAIEKNKAKLSVIKLLKKEFPDEIKDARTIWTGRFNLPIESKDMNFRLITVMEEGRMKGYYVDPYIASIWNTLGTGRMNAVLGVFRFLNHKLFKPLFTTYNLGFQTFNLFRDFMRFYKNVPSLSFPRALLRYKQALRPAIARAWDIPNSLITEMEEKKILGITYNDVVAGLDEEDKQIDYIFKRYGLEKSEASRRALFKIPLTIMDQISRIGNFVETIPKVAGYIELQGKFPERELASFIRTSVGSPDFLRKGAGYGWYNEIFLYSNAMKEGIRADLGVVTNPRTRAGWWMKTIAFTLLPKMIMYAGLLGVFGKLIKKMLEDASEYDKTNYTIIPLGVDENGRTVYLRVPQDETGRFIGGFFWKSLNLTKEKSLSFNDVAEILSYTGGQVPSLSPSITSVFATAQFLAGNNPYDFFRGRPVIPDTEFQAGGKYALKPFLTWQFNQLGGGIFHRFYYTQQAPETETWVQKVIDAPVISNIVGRWVKVSDYGQKEINREIIKETEQQQARETLRRRELLDKYVGLYRQDKSKRDEYEDKLVEEVLGHKNPKDSEEKTLRTNTIKKFNIAIVRGEADANLNSLIDANTNAEKVEILKRLESVMDQDEYKKLLKKAKDERIISDNVLDLLKK